MDDILKNRKILRAKKDELQKKLSTQNLKLQKLFNRITTFNETVGQIDEDWGEDYKLGFSEPVSDDLLQKMEQQLFKTTLPEDLKIMYKELGTIMSYGHDLLEMENKSFMIERYTYSKVNNKFEGRTGYIKSLGLIDCILDYWGGDREEFDDEELVNKADIDYLNENYKCFGYCRFNGGLDEAYYFYFDKNKKFGWVRYHQDEFDALWEEHLNEMLAKSQADKTLEEFLISVIDELEKEIVEDSE